MTTNFDARYMLVQNQSNPKKFEPLRKHSWELDIPGFTNELHLVAEAVKLPSYTVEPITIWHVNEATKIAGRPTLGDGSITVRDTVSPDMASEIWDWFNKIFKTTGDLGQVAAMGYASDYKKSGTITQFDVTGAHVRTWKCFGLWPKAAPNIEDLTYEDSAICKITFELSCDRVELVKETA